MAPFSATLTAASRPTTPPTTKSSRCRAPVPEIAVRAGSSLANLASCITQTIIIRVSNAYASDRRQAMEPLAKQLADARQCGVYQLVRSPEEVERAAGEAGLA